MLSPHGHPLYEGEQMTSRRRDDEVLVVIGSGGMGLCIARRVGAGRVIVLADIDRACLDTAAEALSGEGHRVVTRDVDVTCRSSVGALAELAERSGRVAAVVHTAGLSPQQASAQAILAVDLLGVALVLDEFGAVIAPGGAGVVIASMAAHMYPHWILSCSVNWPTRPPTSCWTSTFARRSQTVAWHIRLPSGPTKSGSQLRQLRGPSVVPGSTASARASSRPRWEDWN
ncbi:short chain dehydrogenase family protein [Mycobacterium xenopi 4042]|uniref:Short chain dehydrogenase family protein n=1 Tax=Mycobacterium xenopi 4042 TaxID=1299334 RepID=X8AH56_MYCXE|nr:short chain dehydrogenase family protein [Mycobacterium xenopi 4042]